jgi:hypothetical protein
LTELVEFTGFRPKTRKGRNFLITLLLTHTKAPSHKGIKQGRHLKPPLKGKRFFAPASKKKGEENYRLLLGVGVSPGVGEGVGVGVSTGMPREILIMFSYSLLASHSVTCLPGLVVFSM